MQQYLHSRKARFLVLVTHRRLGKSVYCIGELIDKSLRLERTNPRYAYVAPTYRQAKKIAWDYLRQFTKRIPGVRANSQELTLTIPRPWKEDEAQIMLLGAEDPDSLRGIYLDGAILDEYGTMNPIIWTRVLRPALSDRRGWARICGTPAGDNHFAKAFYHGKAQQKEYGAKSSWEAHMFKASETGILPQDELDDARAMMSEDEYNQEYECDFNAMVTGAYYAAFVRNLEQGKRIIPLRHEPDIDVTTYWDLGMDDMTAIWFAQQVNGEIRFIDYYQNNGKDLHHYVKVLRQTPYIYANYGHNWPHDVEVRELGSGKTRKELFQAAGLVGNTLPRMGFLDGINAARRLLKGNVWFDVNRCEEGIAALQGYRKEFDGKLGTFKDRPKKTWHCHGADAFRMAAECIVLPGERISDKMGANFVRESSYASLLDFS